MNRTTTRALAAFCCLATASLASTATADAATGPVHDHLTSAIAAEKQAAKKKTLKALRKALKKSKTELANADTDLSDVFDDEDIFDDEGDALYAELGGGTDAQFNAAGAAVEDAIDHDAMAMRAKSLKAARSHIRTAIAAKQQALSTVDRMADDFSCTVTYTKATSPDEYLLHVAGCGHVVSVLRFASPVPITDQTGYTVVKGGVPFNGTCETAVGRRLRCPLPEAHRFGPNDQFILQLKSAIASGGRFGAFAQDADGNTGRFGVKAAN